MADRSHEAKLFFLALDRGTQVRDDLVALLLGDVEEAGRQGADPRELEQLIKQLQSGRHLELSAKGLKAAQQPVRVKQ